MLAMIFNIGLASSMNRAIDENEQCKIIRKISVTHCKRGPARCVKCKATSKETICLLNICPEDAGKVARRVIPIKRNGKIEYREFDVIKQFESSDEALQFAKDNNISDIEIDERPE